MSFRFKSACSSTRKAEKGAKARSPTDDDERMRRGKEERDTTASLLLTMSDSNAKKKVTVSLLDYGAGNVRSVRNAITSCGYSLVDITRPVPDRRGRPSSSSPASAPTTRPWTCCKREGYDAALRVYLAAGPAVPGHMPGDADALREQRGDRTRRDTSARPSRASA